MTNYMGMCKANSNAYVITGPQLFLFIFSMSCATVMSVNMDFSTHTKYRAMQSEAWYDQSMSTRESWTSVY